MSILLTGAGGLFTRLGLLAGTLDDVNNFRGGTSAGQLKKELVDCLAQVDGDADPAIRGSYTPLVNALSSAQGGLTPLANALQAAAQALLVTQAHADTPLAALTYQNALGVLLTQMKSGSYKVNPNTVSYSVAAGGSNVGNGTIVLGLRDKFGYQLDNLLAEAIAATVISDATAGSEVLQLTGATAQQSALWWQWPGGSACNKALTSLLDSAAANQVSNGNFESWGANTPSSFTATVGAAGAEFQKSSAPNAYKDTAALQLIGGTGQLTTLTQNLSGLAARTPYALCVQIKADVVPAAGTLILEMVDGNSAVIVDEAGNNCSLAINCHTLTTSYAPYSIVWQLPDPLAATVTLRLRLSVAISGGSNVFLDSLAQQPAVQLGAQPGDTAWAAVFGGNANWVLRDVATATTVNNRTCKWQQKFDQFFNMRQLGYALPTSGATLINDNLIA